MKVLLKRFTCALNSSGWWWWKIRTSNGVLRSKFTETRTFHVCRSTRPDVPALLEPSQASFNLPDTVTFAWIPVKYFGTICEGRGSDSGNHVQLLLDSNPVLETIAGIVYPDDSNSTNLEPSFLSVSGLETGQYYWRVRAVNTENVTTDSEIRTFTVCVDTPPKEPILTSPTNMSVDQETEVSLSWLPLNQISGDFGTYSLVSYLLKSFRCRM